MPKTQISSIGCVLLPINYLNKGMHYIRVEIVGGGIGDRELPGIGGATFINNVVNSLLTNLL